MYDNYSIDKLFLSVKKQLILICKVKEFLSALEYTRTDKNIVEYYFTKVRCKGL